MRSDFLGRGDARLGRPAGSATSTGALLRAAGLAPAAGRVSFAGKLPEIVAGKPAGSRIVVAADEGAVIFMSGRTEWTRARLAAAAAVVAYLAFTLIWVAAWCFAAASAIQIVRSGGDWIAMFAAALPLAIAAYLAATAPAKIMTAVVDPKFVFRGDPEDRRPAREGGANCGIDRYRETIAALSDEEAKWLEGALRLLYPRMQEIG